MLFKLNIIYELSYNNYTLILQMYESCTNNISLI